MNHLQSPYVHELSNLKLMGHQVHPSWYKCIKLPDGSTDFLGITLLAEVVYKHLQVYDGKSGLFVQKFKGESWSIKLSDLARKFDVSSSEISEGLNRLQQRGLISYRAKKNDSETIVIEPVVDAIKETMFDARRAAPACPNPSESDIPPRLASASPSALRQRGTVPVDPAIENKVQDFVNFWCVCQDITGHETRIRPGDVDAAREHFQINPDMDIVDLMSQAVEAWFASGRKRPGKGVDCYFYCRKSMFMSYFFEYRDHILFQLHFNDHDEPEFVTDVLNRAQQHLTQRVQTSGSGILQQPHALPA